MIYYAGKIKAELKLVMLACLILSGAAAYRISARPDNSTDEAAVSVTTKAELPSADAAAIAMNTEAETVFLLLDINAASAEELTQLDGIGEHLAAEIVRYRESSGGFRNIEEIMNVSGIGSAVFEDIREHIFVADPVYEVTTTAKTTKPPKAETTEPVRYTEPETEYVPTLEDVAPIDLNSADSETLMLLPHVDEETAAAIIDLRERIGGYSNYYELLYIDGLSEKDVSEIGGYVVVIKETE